MKRLLFVLAILAASVAAQATEAPDSLSIFDYTALDSAITASPNRIDLRHKLLDEAIRNKDMAKVAEMYTGLLDYGLNHQHVWATADSILSGDAGKELTSDVAYEALSELYNANYDNLFDYSHNYVWMFPHDVRGQVLEGSILFGMGEYKKALHYFKTVEELDPYDPIVLINSAMAYMMLGQKDEAVKRCQLIIANDRASDGLKENAIELLNYLDAKKQEMTPYYFAHQWLSVIAPQIPVEDGEILASADMLNTDLAGQNGLVSPFANDDIVVETFIVDAKTVYVWKLPEPQKLRQALYVVFVPDDGHFKAYAISIGQMVDWELSTSDDSKRSTYGRIRRPSSAADCVEAMKERGVFSDKIIPGEFMQEGYQSPSY